MRKAYSEKANSDSVGRAKRRKSLSKSHITTVSQKSCVQQSIRTTIGYRPSEKPLVCPGKRNPAFGGDLVQVGIAPVFCFHPQKSPSLSPKSRRQPVRAFFNARQNSTVFAASQAFCATQPPISRHGIRIFRKIRSDGI